MAHIAKYTRADTGRILGHYDIERPHAYYKDDHIDRKRVDLNYTIGQSELSLQEQHAYCMERYKPFNRKDVVTMCDMVITLPEDVRTEDTYKFFQGVYGFMCDKFGVEDNQNIYTASIHDDEVKANGERTRIHGHYAFMPVTWNDKKQAYTCNAKQTITKDMLKSLHAELSAYMEKELGYHISIETGTTDRSLTVAQWNSLQKQKQAIRAELEAVEPDKGGLFRTRQLEQENKFLKEQALIQEKQSRLVPGIIKELDYYKSITQPIVKAEAILTEAQNRAAEMISHAKYEAEHMPLNKELEWADKVSKLEAENHKLTKELNGFKKFIKENDLIERFNEWVKEAQKALSRGRGR